MRNLTTVAYIIAAAILCGCASAGNNFDSRKIGTIQKGVTTESDLVASFGPPQNRTADSDGKVTLVWVYSEAKVKGETFIPFAGAFVGGSTVKTKSLSAELVNGTVAKYSYSGGGMESGGIKPDPEQTPK